MKKTTFAFFLAVLISVCLCGCTVNKDSTVRSRPEGFQIHCVDVGQADCSVIYFPDGKTMMIDAGNNDDADLIKEYLTQMSVSKIDYMVGTHPHEDHIGSMDTVIDNFDIGEIYMPKVSYSSKTYLDVLESIERKKLSVIGAKAGMKIASTDDYDVEILSPARDKYSDINEYSAVIMIGYKNNKFLFMGDAEKENETELEGDVSADVIKIGHHGSKTSTSDAFIDRVKPQYAIISVGADNTYGHPSEQVLKKLQERKICIFRTDESGTIKIKSDGQNIKIEAERKK